MILSVLQKEVLLFQKALQIEKKKRKAILNANGRQIQELVRETEECIKGIEAMEAERQRLLQSTQSSNANPSRPTSKSFTLRELIKVIKQEDPQTAEKLEKTSDIYQKSVLQLKESTQENQILLEATNRSIQTFLGEEKSIYSPSQDPPETSSPKKLNSLGILFNTKV